MKKRMFLSTILMTLVLLLAVTTATFAWYSAATGAGHSEEGAAVNTITTATNDFSAGSVKFTASLTEVSGTPHLTDLSGKTYYYAGATKDSAKVEASLERVPLANRYGSAKVSVSAEVVNAGNATLANLLPLLAGNTVTVTITSTSSNVRLYTAQPTQISDLGASQTVAFTYNITESSTLATIIDAQTFYFAVTGAENVETAVSNLNITATVTYAPTPTQG